MCTGYYAVGTDITLTAICPPENPQNEQPIVLKDILTTDLSTREGRIRNAASTIRLVKILRRLELTVRQDVDADMLTLDL